MKKWTSDSYVVATITSLSFLFLSLVINYWAMNYAQVEASNPVTDILLSNLPIINTDWIFSEGAILFILFLIPILYYHREKIPFVLNSLSLFIIIRSCFVSMTHLAPFPEHISTDLTHYKVISAGSDLFFSGHTGIPYLLSLIFWENIYLRYYFLASSVIAAVAVILGHLHYTIDVASAYFITYTIYTICVKCFSTKHIKEDLV